MRDGEGGESEQAVADMQRRLAAHYGEPVLPVSRYCNAFRVWHQALIERQQREDAAVACGELDEQFRDDALREALEALNNPHLQMQIAKSNMLGRLIYGGQNVRTQMCPVHKGVWSGLGHCDHGCDETGWIYNG
jgi:hypothetical protein